MTIVFLISSALDLLSIGFIGAYIGLLVSPSFLLEIQNTYLPFEYFYGLSSEEFILIIGYGLLAIFITKFLAIIFTNFLIFKFANYEQLKIQKHIIESYINQEYEKFILTKNADYLASVMSYSSGYREFLMNSLLFFSSLLVVIGVFFALAIISFSIVFWILIGLTVIMGIYNFYFKNKIQLYGKEFVSGSADIMQSTQEVAGGMKEIKIMGAETMFFRTFSQAAKKMANGQIGLNITGILPRSILELFLIVFIVGMITKDIILSQDIAPTIILLGTFATAMVRILPLISQLQSSVNTINYHYPSVHRLAEIIRLNGIDLSENPEKLDSQSNSLDAFNNAENMFRQLKLDNISYTYPNSSKASIRSVNIEINKGDYIGIVGPSGAGKTTLIDIILGFLKPTNGSLKLNNNDAHHNIKKLRMLCAYIPQDIFLINGTLKKNITMQNSDICNEKMANVIKSSNLEDFLHDLPDGIDTDLGDKGVRLSGGQKQRVSIARALYFDREILVMDESTSALDSKTEKKFIDKLVKLKKKKTIISIAHRVSTLKNCNKIYTVNNGQVTGPFTYREIAAK